MSETNLPSADFGVSEQLQSNTKFIAADDYVGSPLFMAPEVIRKEGYNGKVDEILWLFFFLEIEGIPQEKLILLNVLNGKNIDWKSDLWK